MTQQRNAALAKFAQQAEAQSKKIALNQWVLPVSPSVTTAEFGDYGLWASYHTGLDFNGYEGQPIMAVANGVVTSVGYDGSYGNKTVVTLDDGTEIWYCHQSSFGVSEGDEVRAGEVIGDRRLHRQRDRLPPPPRGAPRRRRPGRPLRGVHRPRPHAVEPAPSPPHRSSRLGPEQAVVAEFPTRAPTGEASTPREDRDAPARHGSSPADLRQSLPSASSWVKGGRSTHGTHGRRGGVQRLRRGPHPRPDPDGVPPHP